MLQAYQLFFEKFSPPSTNIISTRLGVVSVSAFLPQFVCSGSLVNLKTPLRRLKQLINYSNQKSANFFLIGPLFLTKMNLN